MTVSRSGLHSYLRLLLVSALWCVAQIAAAQTDADRAFEEGSAAFEAGDDQTALRKMRTAFKAQASYRNAAGLGQVELHLARYRDAAEHLEFSLRNYPATGDPEGRELVMRGFAEARSHVVTLTLEAQIAGAALLVDGERLATLPVEHDLFVDPGQHRTSFAKAGFESDEKEQYFAAGSQHTLRVELRPLPADDSGTAGVSSGAAAPDPGIGPTIVTVGGLATLVGLGLGAGFHFGAQAAADDADALRARLRETGVACEAGEFQPGCENLERTLERSSDRQTASTVAFVGAAGTAVVTLVAYTIAVLADDTEPAAKPEASALAWSHCFGVGSAWTGVTGRF